MVRTPGAMVASAARWLLAAVLLVAGIGHLVNVEAFLAQVPPWFPVRAAVVGVSGVVELAFGVALLVTRGRRRVQVGFVVAAFFVAVFPGNISQYVTGADAFGLDTDTGRAVRLVFQPVLVGWALWCTGAWQAWRAWRARGAWRAGRRPERCPPEVT